MTKDTSTPSKGLTVRHYIGIAFLIWLACAIIGISMLGRYDEYGLADAMLSNQSRYSVTTMFAAVLMLLSYAYILAEPLGGRVLWPISRVVIVLGMFGWAFVAFWDILYAFGSYPLSSFRFARWAYFYPTTTLIAYWIFNLIGWELFRRVFFVILCVVLPLIHFYLGVEAAR